MDGRAIDLEGAQVVVERQRQQVEVMAENGFMIDVLLLCEKKLRLH